jgi:hypothetical protein
LADSGFHSEANMKMLEGKEINGYVADRNMRKRDPAYVTAKKHGGKIEGIQGKTRRNGGSLGRKISNSMNAESWCAQRAVNCI